MAAVAGSAFFGCVPSDPPFLVKSAGGDAFKERACGATIKTLLVYVPSWNGDMNQIDGWPQLKAIRDCVLVSVNKFGPKHSRNGGGSPAQLAHIKASILSAKSRYPDITKTIIVGYSGGAYLTAMMLGSCPGLAQGAVAWYGINDLAAWWNENRSERTSIEECLGGPPSELPAQYRARSPIGVLPNARDCEVFIANSLQDVEVEPHQQVDMWNELNGRPGVILHPLLSIAGGHVMDAGRMDIFTEQIKTLIG